MSSTGQWLIELVEEAQSGNQLARGILIANGYRDLGPQCCAAAMEYCERFGWAVIPQRVGTKRPHVRWKGFKDELRRPSAEQIVHWYETWPEAGVIVLLGPVSGLFAIDVDGEGAHSALANRLGRVPKAPTSWRGKKFRYHLLFRHPDGVATNAKFTPWHPQLEFRGHGGYLVLPPSAHESGQSYRWRPGRSLDDLPLPDIPGPVLEALQEREHRRRTPRNTVACGVTELRPLTRVTAIPGLAMSTRLFLSGRFANASQWNDRLFRAACDLAGNQVDEDSAIRMLLAAARPWNDAEQQSALATIKSAYSENRTPARTYFAAKKTRLGVRREVDQNNQTTIIRIKQ